MNRREILIIENESRSRRNIKAALKNEDYYFIEAESVKDAIAKSSQNPDAKVILLDLSFPDGSGVKFLEHINSTASRYRVIILSAHEEKLAAEKARDFAVFNYLPKASRSFTESLRFSVGQAFTDIDRDNVRNKNKRLVDIQKKINTEILESSSVEDTLHSLDRILTTICKTVTDPDFIGAHTCHISLYSLSKGELYLASFDGSDDSVRVIFNDPDGLFSGKVAKSRMPRIFTDLQNNKDFRVFKETKLAEIRSTKDSSLREKAETYFDTVKSAYIIPITTQMFDNETDAVFSVSSESKDFFSEERQEVVKEFVTLATSAITKAWQKKRKVESLQDYRSISKVLEKISKKLGGKNVKDKIYNEFLNGVSKIINPETISIFLYSERTKLLENKAEFQGDMRVPPRAEGHSLNRGLTGNVFQNRQPIRIPDLQKGDRRTIEQHKDYDEELAQRYIGEIPSGRIKHYLGVPMVFGENVIGVIQLVNKTSAYYKKSEDKNRWLLGRGFSNDCEYVLGIAASHLAVAIKNAELFEERARQIEQLEILKDVGRYTSTEMLDQLLNKINDQAAKAVKAEICLMFLLDETESKVVLEQSYGIPIEDLTINGQRAEYEIGEGLAGEAARTGISKLEEAEEPTGKYDQQILQYLSKDGQGQAIESLMVVPIKVNNKIFGVIKAINKKVGGEQYTNDDLIFFENIASYVGIAFENGYWFASKELAAAESNFNLSNLMYAIAHEFGNTWGHIPDNVDELRDSITGIKENEIKLLDEIKDLTLEMLYFTSEISGYSLGRKPVLEVIDITKLVDETILKFKDRSNQDAPNFRKAENYDQVSLEFFPLEFPLKVEIYRFPIISTVRNIIINAYQALAEKGGGEIEITTYKEKGNAVIKVTDNGTGIKEEYRDQIFGPEFTTKRGKSGKGSGLGLWLARTQVESLGGKISFETEEGVGTSFFIELPLYKD